MISVSVRALQGSGCAALLSAQVHLTFPWTLPSSTGLIGLEQGHSGVMYSWGHLV